MIEQLSDETIKMPLNVENRLFVFLIRSILSKENKDWNQVAICLESLEGAVSRQLDDAYNVSLRQVKLFAIQTRLFLLDSHEEEDVADYKRMVESYCEKHTTGDVIGDRNRFLAVVSDPEHFREQVPDSELFSQLRHILDGIEETMPPSFLKRVSKAVHLFFSADLAGALRRYTRMRYLKVGRPRGRG